MIIIITERISNSLEDMSAFYSNKIRSVEISPCKNVMPGSARPVFRQHIMWFVLRNLFKFFIEGVARAGSKIFATPSLPPACSSVK